MPKSVLTLIALLLLASCKSVPNKFEYNPQGLSPDKLASIVTSGGYEKEGYILATWITGVYDEKGTSLTKTHDRFSGAEDEIKLPKGKYLVQVSCTLGVTTTFYNYHTLEVSVKPKEKYMVYCLDKMGKGLFGLAVPDGAIAFISKLDNYEREKSIYQAKIDAMPLKKD